jgi:hypothetical protein
MISPTIKNNARGPAIKLLRLLGWVDGNWARTRPDPHLPPPFGNDLFTRKHRRQPFIILLSGRCRVGSVHSSAG